MAVVSFESDALHARLEAVLEAEVRRELLDMGVGVVLVGIDHDRIAQVRFTGACQSCSSSIPVLITTVERVVKARVPEIRFVEAVP